MRNWQCAMRNYGCQFTETAFVRWIGNALVNLVFTNGFVRSEPSMRNWQCAMRNYSGILNAISKEYCFFSFRV